MQSTGLVKFCYVLGKRTPHSKNLEAIKSALDSAGIEFIAQNGGGAGVRLAARLE